MRGASLVELLVATALALVLSGLAARAAIEAADAFAWQPTSSELSARAEALARMLTADLAAAGAGPRLRPPGLSEAIDPVRLRSWLPPILPRVVALGGGDADDLAAADRVSILTVADRAPQAAVRRAPPRWDFVPGPRCPALVDGCRFGDGLPVLWLEPRYGFQLGAAAAVDAASLAVDGIAAAGDDALAVGVEVVSYRFDPARGELLRGRAAGRGLGVAGQVLAFAVELWGDAEPPAGTPWTPGQDTCVTLADGRPRLPALAAPGAPLVRLDPSQLADGPWCGVAPFRFDADLFRVRRVRVRLRLGADAGPVGGAAVARRRPARQVRDIALALEVAPPALRGPS